MTTQPFTIVGRGVYTLRDAARLTSIPGGRIRRWLQGYDFRSRSRVHHTAPVFGHDYREVDHRLILSFADLVEVRFIDAFLHAGVSWSAIRIAAERASKLLEQDHPFSTRRFKTDGRTIMTDIAAGTRAPELLDLVQNQVALRRIVAPYLYRGLDFGPGQQVSRWWHEAGRRRVVIDPSRAFGKPILAKEAVPTRALFDAYLVEESIDQIAEMFEVSRSSASAAIEFEKRLAA